MNPQQVADIFVEQQVLEPSQADDVIQEAQLNGKNIDQALIDGGFVDRHGFTASLPTRSAPTLWSSATRKSHRKFCG